MKRKLLCIALISAVAIFACRKDFSPDDGAAMSNPFLTEAKSYYYKEAQKSGILSVSKLAAAKGLVKSQQRSVTPLWAKNFTAKTGENVFTEVPIITNKKIIALYNFAGKKTDARINLSSVNASFQRLLIYKTAKGNLHQVVLTYIPDYDYLEKNNFDASINQINKTDSYTGYI